MSKCTLCGEEMPRGEEMFNYHGYSGPCPRPPLDQPITLKEIFDLVDVEVAKARNKFPASTDLLHAFTEEAGEVTREFLQLKYHGGNRHSVRKELIQVMAVAVRLLQEGDPNFPSIGRLE